MKDLHDIFTIFNKDFPTVNEGHEGLGKIIHEQGGPLPEKVRWLIKVAVSGASDHKIPPEPTLRKQERRERLRTRSSIRCF